jgi:4-carboxymuconolactone decarboxylase
MLRLRSPADIAQLSDNARGRLRQQAPSGPVTLPAMKSTFLDLLPDFPEPLTAEAHLSANDNAAPPAEAVSRGDDRRSRGLRALAEITGESGVAVVEDLREIAPDLADWIIDFSYGDVMARPGLDGRTRQLATIAALTAMGNAQAQLRMHVQGALKMGCKPQEIIEVILQMTVYCGFPAALNALSIVREVTPSSESMDRRI